MEWMIGGKPFRYVENALENRDDREGYFALAQAVFGLDFRPWYNSGFCGDSFRPYTLYDGECAAASVGIVAGEFQWQDRIRRFSQISTVMTDPNYRGMGLSRWLLERVLAEWAERSDLVYLYANDSVLGYYPCFGFEAVAEYTYTLPVTPQPGRFRRIDPNDPGDRALLIKKYTACNNPFSALTMQNNVSMLMFHCLTFLQRDIYYVEPFDAIIIAKHQGETIFCHDIYTGARCGVGELLGVLATDQTAQAVLGFTPIQADGLRCEQAVEDDTTVFALGAGESIFSTHRVTFPYLSRA